MNELKVRLHNLNSPSMQNRVRKMRFRGAYIIPSRLRLGLWRNGHDYFFLLVRSFSIYFHVWGVELLIYDSVSYFRDVSSIPAESLAPHKWCFAVWILKRSKAVECFWSFIQLSCFWLINVIRIGQHNFSSCHENTTLGGFRRHII